MLSGMTSDERDAYVVELRRMGFTLSSIGKEIGVSTARVRQLIARCEYRWATATAPGIRGLGLSCRAFNCIMRSNITTIDYLRKMTDRELLGISNLGRGSVREIRAALAKRDEKAPDA